MATEINLLRTKVVIAVSGCGGCNQGPQQIYSMLQKLYGNDSLTVFPVDTLPDNIEENVATVISIALKYLSDSKDIYLMGYSMGGAVAVQAANELNQRAERPVKGVVLLNSQIEGLQYLNGLDVPVLFYQGEADSVFPLWQIESIFTEYSGLKRMVKMADLNHELSQENISSSKEFMQCLAKTIFSEMSCFLFNSRLNEHESKSIVVTKIVSPPSKKGIFSNFVNIFRNCNCCSTAKKSNKTL